MKSYKKVKRIRATFQRKDSKYLYVRLDGFVAGQMLRKVAYGVKGVNEEFNATCDCLWKDCQINLLDVANDEDGNLLPSFIVVEPDYLLDISSLAECYKPYGSTPSNYLLSRLTPSEETIPLILGNFANLFLDECINTEGKPDYLKTLQKAFHKYPLSLTACRELRDSFKAGEFFKNCGLQFSNIVKTVNDTFTQPEFSLDKNDAVLEPSYICEPLGIQGRLDFMQRDMSSFIEMKSGKADEYSYIEKIVPNENNRVQMLLYQAVLEYSMGVDHSEVKPYLFYTRYPLLYHANTSWVKLRQIIDLRNRIVATDHSVCQHNDETYTEQLLFGITPVSLNEKHVSGRFWRQFLEPQIQNFAVKLRTLNAVERSYFITLYNFITRELYLSKCGGNGCHGKHSASSLWLSSIQEKIEEGDILPSLTIIESNASDTEVPFLVLKIDKAKHADKYMPVNFREGDAVLLYLNEKDGDSAVNRMVFKGTLTDISDVACKVELRAPQRNTSVLPLTAHYAMEHDYMDTSFRVMYQGLSLFLEANADRRSLILGTREPVTDERYLLNNASSSDFTRIVEKAKAAKDYFLLVGPPGTGKTSKALRGMVEAFYNEGNQILLLAYTNRAVDEICKMLEKIMPSVEYIRIGVASACHPDYHSRLLCNIVRDCANRREVFSIIDRCRIFVGTVTTISSRPQIFNIKTFDVALIDEATQILEPQLLGLLSMKNKVETNSIGKFILIGDHKQLPAVVLQPSENSEVRNEKLRSLGIVNIKDSLFERLYRHLSLVDNKLSLDMLCRQGRMHEDISSFPNKAFYGEMLKSAGLSHQSGPIDLAVGVENLPYHELLKKRVAFVPSYAELCSHSFKTNRSEAIIVAKLSETIFKQYGGKESFNPATTLGIITPYRYQIAMIRRMLSDLKIPQLMKVTVDTVERFQGSERDVIIYSFCVNKQEQLEQLSNTIIDNGIIVDRKLNVALTRARKQLFLTGAPSLLRLNPIYSDLLDFLGYDE